MLRLPKKNFWTAAKFTAADEFINNLPKKYETLVEKMVSDFQEVRNKGFL